MTSFLEAITNDSNKSLNNVAIEACAAYVDVFEGHVGTVSKMVDHTKEKSRSKQAHNRLTKQKRLEAQSRHTKLKMYRSIKNYRKKALVAAIEIKRAKESLQKHCADATLEEGKRKSAELISVPALISLPPRQGKKQKCTKRDEAHKLIVFLDRKRGIDTPRIRAERSFRT